MSSGVKIEIEHKAEFESQLSKVSYPYLEHKIT